MISMAETKITQLKKCWRTKLINHQWSHP